MNRKKYSLADYNKSEPFDDSCVKFFIIYEGADKEPNYFEAFSEKFIEKKKAYIHHILENDPTKGNNTPLKLKERAANFINNPPKDLKFTPSVEDKFRFVLDVDKHPINQITDLKEFNDVLLDSKLFISNFCFEVWLWFHLDNQYNIQSKKSKELKKEFGLKQNVFGINFPHGYMNIELITKAIERAKQADIDKNDYFPTEKSTKVYQLMEELLAHSVLNNDVLHPEIL
jgi:hypothetical protein